MKKFDDNAGHVCIAFGFEMKDVAIPLHFPTPDRSDQQASKLGVSNAFCL